MEKYDVVIIGGGLGSLTTATYLSKRLRNVAVFEENKQKKLLKYATRIKDDLNNKYEFKFYHHDLGGVHEGDLFYEYMSRCGLENKFEYYDNEYAMVIDHNKRLVKRPNNLKEFKIYLIRKFPKQRDNVHSLFTDIERHYEDFKLQKSARLKNLEYTIPSVLIEWGDLNLDEVLSSYFTDELIIDEFTLVHDAVGHSPEDINAYNYFIKFFDTFIDGSHFIKNSFNQIVKGFSGEISKIKDRIFTGRKIKEFIIEDGKILKVIDTEGNEIEATHFVINMRVDDFINEYAPLMQKELDEFRSMYRATKEEKYINQLVLGLDKDASELGINEKQYIFSNISSDTVRICSVMNYKLIDPTSCKDGLGALMVEFIDDDSPRKEKERDVIDQLCKYFPGIVDHISVSKLGVKQLLISGVSEKDYWANKTINDKFSIDDYTAVNPLSNGYFIGAWVRPEAGVSGIIQTGVEYGDMIDDLIYRGDDEDYFIEHDELIAIIADQFIPGALGNEEKNVQFFIGKVSYYIRTKGKLLQVYRGVSEISDIIIIATNEVLYDLSVGNSTLEKAIESGSFEFVGEKEFLDDVIEAFDMGIEAPKVTAYNYIPGRWGLLSIVAMFSVLLISNLLGNYHPYTIIAPFTIIAIAGIGYFKYTKIKYISLFEYVTVGLYLALFIVSLFVNDLNTMEDSKYTTLFFAVYLLFSWLINRPIIYGYIKYDYRTDFTRTKLFNKMSGGLTFIWGFIFLTISLISFATDETTYSSLAYYLIVLGLYFMYYYPNTYIKGNIIK